MSSVPKIDAYDHLFTRLHDQSSDELVETLRTRAELLHSGLFSKQKAYMADMADKKTLMCPRRTGKTWVIAVELLTEMFLSPYAKVAYITLTRTQGKRNLWDLLQQLNSEYNLELKFNHTELTFRSQNGSIGLIGGALTKADVERYRGLYLDKACVDETASFDPDLLSDLVDEVLHYCLLDKQGSLTLAGTPGPVLAGAFWEASDTPGFEVKTDGSGNKYCLARPYKMRNAPEYEGVAHDWSFHGWGMQDNTALPHLWKKALAKHKRQGGHDQDPIWQREALGRWVSDSSAFVYRYQERKNGWEKVRTVQSPHGLPLGHNWHFICGVDLGYDDDFDIEIAAWSATCDKFYHVTGYSKSNMTISQMAEAIKGYDRTFDFDIIIGDTGGLGKAIFEEMRSKHGVSVEPAKKTDKRDYIELMNSELYAGRCMILKGSTLEGQLKTLLWEDPRTKRREHPKMDNHATDAWLYVTRYAMHHYSRPMEHVEPRGTKAWWDVKLDQDEIDAENSELAAQSVTRRQKWAKGVDSRFAKMTLEAKLRRYLN